MEYIKKGDVYRFGSIVDCVQMVRSLQREGVKYKIYYDGKLDYFTIIIREV